MSETRTVAEILKPDTQPEQVSSAAARWMQDLGRQSESLAAMLRKPTDSRPFVYEVRFDLLPVKAKDSLVVLKGFGGEGGLCAFVNGGSFLGLLRQSEELLRSGKLRWYEDTYAPSNYAARADRYKSGEFYLV